MSTAKKPAAQLRRVKTPPGFRLLPHAGRDGPAPPWPLGKPTAAEKRHWAKLWRLPQAVEWERMRCDEMVALYVRVFVAVSNGVTNHRMLGELRQLDAKIGLSPRAMLDLRWETDAAPAPATPTSIVPAEAPRVFVVPGA